MRGYRFRLERVLRVRAIEEELARAAWQEAEARVAQAREEQACLRDELATASEELARLVGGGEGGSLEPAQILWRQRALERLAGALVRVRRRLTRLENAAELERGRWRAARSEMQALEHLDSRRRDEHAREAERRANAQLDEVALMRDAARRRQTKGRPAPEDSATAAPAPSSGGPSPTSESGAARFGGAETP